MLQILIVLLLSLHTTSYIIHPYLRFSRSRYFCIASDNGNLDTNKYDKYSQSKQLNRFIIDIFDRKRLLQSDLENLRLRILQSNSFNQINAVTLMHRCSKRNVEIRRIISEDLLLSSLNIETGGKMSSQSIANAIYSLHKSTDADSFVCEIIAILNKQLMHNKDIFDGQAITNILYGMKSFCWKSEKSLELLEAVKKMILRTHRSTISVSNPQSNNNDGEVYLLLTSQGIASSLLGLQRLSCNEDLKHFYLRLISNSLQHRTTPINAVAFSNILLALKNDIADNSFEASKLLENILQIASNSSDIIDRMQAKELSISMWAAPAMTAAFPTASDQLVRILNSVMERDFASSSQRLKFESSEEVCMLAAGLRGMAPDNPMVLKLIANINRVLQHSNAISTSDGSSTASNANSTSYGISKNNTTGKASSLVWYKVGNTEQRLSGALYGLQGMESRSEAVRDLLSHILLSFRAVPAGEKWSFVSIATGLYGLKSMSVSDKPVVGLVRELGRLINEEAAETVSGGNIAMAFYGLQGIGSSPSVDGILHKLSNKVTQAGKDISAANLAMAMYGMQGMNSDRAAVRKNILAFSEVLDRLSSEKQSLDGQQIVMILHGLSEMTCDWSGMRLFLSRLANLIQESGSLMTNAQLSTSLRSLKSMGGDKPRSRHELSSRGSGQNHNQNNNQGPAWNGAKFTNKKIVIYPELEALLKVLLVKLQQRKGPLTGAMASTAMYGLQGLSSDYSVVRAIVGELTGDFIKSTDQIGPQNVGNGIYGLQNMGSDSAEVKELLKAWALRLSRMDSPLTAQAIGNAFYGLQEMTNNCEEVTAVVQELSLKLSNSPPGFMLQGQHVGNALWGFKEMTVKDGEGAKNAKILYALKEIAQKIDESTSEMSGQNIANAFFGLQGMHCGYAEVKAVLTALASKVTATSLPISGLDYGMALYGLRNMDGSEPVIQHVMQVMMDKMRPSECRITVRELSMCVLGVMKAPKDVRDEFLNVLSAKSGLQIM